VPVVEHLIFIINNLLCIYGGSHSSQCFNLLATVVDINFPWICCSCWRSVLLRRSTIGVFTFKGTRSKVIYSSFRSICTLQVLNSIIHSLLDLFSCRWIHPVQKWARTAAFLVLAAVLIDCWHHHSTFAWFIRRFCCHVWSWLREYALVVKRVISWDKMFWDWGLIYSLKGSHWSLSVF